MCISNLQMPQSSYTMHTQFYKKKYSGTITDHLNQHFPKQALVFTCLQNKSFENTVGKGEIAHDEEFLLFPQVFSTLL